MNKSGNNYTLVSPPNTDEQYLNWVKHFEGFADYFYIDSTGHITIGTGLEYNNISEVLYGKKSDGNKKLQFYTKPGVPTLTGNKLIEAVTEDFTKVLSEKLRKSGKTERLTTVRATDKSLNDLFIKRLNDAKREATSFFEIPCAADSPSAPAKYRYFNQLPLNVQYALIDMDFNLGATKLKKYKNLKAALKAGDWELAAKHSHRNGIQPERNNEIAKWMKWNRSSIIRPEYNVPRPITMY